MPKALTPEQRALLDALGAKMNHAGFSSEIAPDGMTAAEWNDYLIKSIQDIDDWSATAGSGGGGVASMTDILPIITKEILPGDGTVDVYVPAPGETVHVYFARIHNPMWTPPPIGFALPPPPEWFELCQSGVLTGEFTMKFIPGVGNGILWSMYVPPDTFPTSTIDVGNVLTAVPYDGTFLYGGTIELYGRIEPVQAGSGGGGGGSINGPQVLFAGEITLHADEWIDLYTVPAGKELVVTRIVYTGLHKNSPFLAGLTQGAEVYVGGVVGAEIGATANTSNFILQAIVDFQSKMLEGDIVGIYGSAISGGGPWGMWIEIIGYLRDPVPVYSGQAGGGQ